MLKLNGQNSTPCEPWRQHRPRLTWQHWDKAQHGLPKQTPHLAPCSGELQSTPQPLSSWSRHWKTNARGIHKPETKKVLQDHFKVNQNTLWDVMMRWSSDKWLEVEILCSELRPPWEASSPGRSFRSTALPWKFMVVVLIQSFFLRVISESLNVLSSRSFNCLAALVSVLDNGISGGWTLGSPGLAKDLPNNGFQSELEVKFHLSLAG